MARGKVKKELTLEEKLEQALVPVKEQPYVIPDNWCWARLDNVANYKKGPFGSAITKAMFVPKGDNTYKVYEQGNAIRKTVNYGNYYITEEKYNELKGFAVSPGDLIVSCAGTIGETYQIPKVFEQGIINQALMRVKVTNNVILDYYLLYFNVILRQDITSKSKGSAMNNIPPFSVLKQMGFPLPPLAEQQRIVNRIEFLFAKLDEVKEKLEAVVDSYEARKAAILHKAFTGELTKKWRSLNSLSDYTWVNKELGDLADTQYGYTAKSSQEPVGPKYLRITDIQDNSVNWETVPYCSIEDNELPKYKLSKGDIVVARTGATTGKSYRVVDDVDSVYASYLVGIKIFDSCLADEYLYLFMHSKEYWEQITDYSQGSAQPGVNANKLKKIVLPVPSLLEQKVIVGIASQMLENELEIVKKIDCTLNIISALKKSILARAFRGELGTNDPTEESSIEMLKQILEEK